MLQPVAVANKTLNDYTHICGKDLIAEIRELAEPLKGQRVVHISATAFGGGVSEILYTLVPLMRDVGLDCEWQVIYGREEFFNATKLMHNALQGNPHDLSPEEWEVWERYNEMNARELNAGWDVIVVHDPQPAGLAALPVAPVPPALRMRSSTTTGFSRSRLVNRRLPSATAIGLSMRGDLSRGSLVRPTSFSTGLPISTRSRG